MIDQNITNTTNTSDINICLLLESLLVPLQLSLMMLFLLAAENKA